MNTEIRAALQALSGIVLGKEPQLRLTLACLLARGHLLIEDLPGVGKTTLGHALARVLGLEFQRVQFTADLLPGDITGLSVFDRERGEFRFHPGPVFSQVLLADEINRASPRTQSALLEAMEEHQVTVEGETRLLPDPFFVIATRNPGHQIGTFPMPESQLDRFLMRIRLGYPDPAAERALLAGEDRRGLIASLAPQVSPSGLLALQARVRTVRAAPALLDYLQALVAHTRRPGAYASGLSPRAALALLNAARAWAWMDERSAVLPEDLQAVFPAVAGHRLATPGGATAGGEDPAREVLAAVPVP